MGKPPIMMRKERGHLVPIDAWALEQLDALPEGKDLSVRVTQPRSIGRLNWYWAGLGLLVENLDDEDRAKWPNARKMHNAFLEALGYVEKIWRIDGSFRIQVDSIALDNMTEEEFAQLFENVRAMAVRLFGYDPWQVWMDERPPR